MEFVSTGNTLFSCVHGFVAFWAFWVLGCYERHDDGLDKRQNIRKKCISAIGQSAIGNVLRGTEIAAIKVLLLRKLYRADSVLCCARIVRVPQILGHNNGLCQPLIWGEERSYFWFVWLALLAVRLASFSFEIDLMTWGDVRLFLATAHICHTRSAVLCVVLHKRNMFIRERQSERASEREQSVSKTDANMGETENISTNCYFYFIYFSMWFRNSCAAVCAENWNETGVCVWLRVPVCVCV